MAAAASANAFPRLPLYSAIALITFSIAAAAFGRITDIGTVRVTRANPVAIRDIAFQERANDVLIVADATSRETLATIPSDQDGFIRGVLRGLVRGRMLRQADGNAPYRLILWDDRRLTLSDTATGQRIDLLAFGPTNARAFVRFLDLPTPANGGPGS